MAQVEESGFDISGTYAHSEAPLAMANTAFIWLLELFQVSLVPSSLHCHILLCDDDLNQASSFFISPRIQLQVTAVHDTSPFSCAPTALTHRHPHSQGCCGRGTGSHLRSSTSSCSLFFTVPDSLPTSTFLPRQHSQLLPGTSLHLTVLSARITRLSFTGSRHRSLLTQRRATSNSTFPPVCALVTVAHSRKTHLRHLGAQAVSKYAYPSVQTLTCSPSRPPLVEAQNREPSRPQIAPSRRYTTSTSWPKMITIRGRGPFPT